MIWENVIFSYLDICIEVISFLPGHINNTAITYIIYITWIYNIYRGIYKRSIYTWYIVDIIYIPGINSR